MSPALRKTLIVIAVIAVIAAILYFALLRPDRAEYSVAQLSGTDPIVAEAEAERFPTLGLADPVGWPEDATPTAAEGLSVARFATGLDHPRTIFSLPNGDVLVAETNAQPSTPSGLKGKVMQFLMDKVGAGAPSADRITLLRDGDGDGRADQSFVLLDGLKSPFGMALRQDRLLVANTDAVLSFPFTVGDTRIDGEPEMLMELSGGGQHWARNLLYDQADDRLYVTVGSASNIGEKGMEREQGRAAIFEYDFATGESRLFGGGMRNPNGLALNPVSGELWTTVNERDLMGPDGPPDYLTNVPVGAQYGWPWIYWKQYFDPRVEAPMPEFLREYTRRPEYALGAHTAPLGLVFAGDAAALGDRFAEGAFVARHGSWNRQPLAGYDVVFVGFDGRGNPLEAKPVPVLTGFLTEDGHDAHGRPTWLAWDNSGALLVTDDTAGIVWRVSAPGAQRPARLNADEGAAAAGD